MSTAGALSWAAQTVVIALAFILARRRPQHRPFAAWAAVVLVADIARHFLNAGPLDAPRPYSGALRALFHLDQALWLTEPVGLAAVCWSAFLLSRPWMPLLAGVAAWTALAIGYPWPFRGALLGTAYALIQALAVLASGIAMAVWTRRKAHPRPEHACALFAAGLTCALFSGPYAPNAPEPFGDWTYAELVYLSIWAALALIQAFSIWLGFGMESTGRDRSTRLR